MCVCIYISRGLRSEREKDASFILCGVRFVFVRVRERER